MLRYAQNLEGFTTEQQISNLERLNKPTPRTREIMPAVQGMNRTLCRVTASFGSGIGHAALTIRLSPQEGQEVPLEDWLRTELEQLAGSPWPRGGPSHPGGRSGEPCPDEGETVAGAAGRGRRLGAAGRGLRHGCGPAYVERSALEAHGAQSWPIGDFYLLAHLVTRQDLASSDVGPVLGGNC